MKIVHFSSNDASTIQFFHHINNIFNLDMMQGHGFRTELFEMLSALKPKFIRFPGKRTVVQIEKFQIEFVLTHMKQLKHYFCSVLSGFTSPKCIYLNEGVLNWKVRKVRRK